MFRELRRPIQLLSKEDTVTVLNRCTSGVLACVGDDGYPYAVPISYVYHDSTVYFHSAKIGHKIDALTRDPKVSFCVIDADQIVSKEFTTYFRSVILFGQARIVTGAERLSALAAFVDKYSGDQPEETKNKEIAGSGQALIIAIDVAHMTGKEAIEYVNAKRSNTGT